MSDALVIGGLISDANSAALFEYALGLARNSNPAIGFIATASGDSSVFLEKYYETFRQLRCRPSHLPLFERTPDVRRFISGLDVVLVGGGNTVSMLGAWQPWGLPEILRHAWAVGTVLVGWSAGAICWFEFGLSDAHAERLTPVPGLGIIPGSCCPHYARDAATRDAFQRAIAAGEIPPGWGLDDGAAIHFRGSGPHALLKPSGTIGATFITGDVARASVVELEQIDLPAG